MPSFAVTLDPADPVPFDALVAERPGLRIQADQLAYGDPSRLACVDRPAGLAVPGLSLVERGPGPGQITILADPSGAYPLLVHRGARGLSVASDAAGLCALLPAHERQADAGALEELLAFGQLLGRRSTLHGAMLLTGGAIFRAAEQGSGLAAQPRPQASTPSRSRPADLVEALVAAVGRQARAAGPALLLPISGGLDSRLLLAACLCAGLRPELAVFGAPSSADRRIAGAIASKLGLRLWSFDLDKASIEAAIVPIAMASAGELPLQHGHALAAAGFAAALKDRVVMVGTGGEAFRAFYYDRGMPGFELLGAPWLKQRCLERAVRYVVEHMTSHADDLGPALGQRLDATIRPILEASPDLATGLDRVYREVRMARAAIAGQQILNGHGTRVHPLLDEALVQAFEGLPVRHRLAGGFHRMAIERLAPSLGDIAWDRTGRPLGAGLSWQERWPGLAARLGGAAIYDKAGAPLGDYEAALARAQVPSLLAGLDRLGLLGGHGRRLLEGSARFPARIGAARSFLCWASTLGHAGLGRRAAA